MKRGTGRRGLLTVLALGLALRLLGLGWGLPGRAAPDEPPIHPDEHEVFEGARRLYGEPLGLTFNKGGALFIRVGWLARAAVRAGLGVEPEREWAATLVVLRLLNALLSLATALLVAGIARALDGPAAGLAAAALLLCFPVHVLDSHYARPEVLVTFFSSAALACAFRAARAGPERLLLLGGACAGLGTAAMLSGAVGFAAPAAAALERHGVRGRAARRACGASWARVAAGGLGGWLFGNAEALLHWDAFRQGLEIASSTHQGGHLAFPTALLTVVALYAFGSAAALSAAAGLGVLLRRRAAGSWTLAAHVALAVLLLARVGGDMMRHLEVLAPAVAVLAAGGLAAAARGLVRLGCRPRAAAGVAMGAAVAWTAQLSLAYVWPLQFEEDPRYRLGRWLLAHAEPGARVGVTVSFYGDESYGPRFPAAPPLRIAPLMLRRNFDASRYLDAGLDYVATSEYARTHAGGPTAPAFFRELFAGTRYRLARTEGPGWEPLCIPDLFTERRPGDLLYVRSRFYAFEREPAAAAGPAAPQEDP